jgi:hypothetical protein
MLEVNEPDAARSHRLEIHDRLEAGEVAGVPGVARQPVRCCGGGDQQVGETARVEGRGLPEPLAARPLDGPWASFRTLRRAKQGAFPYLGAHGFELEFAEPIQGPIALGRNSHFGMGLFLPVS